MCTHKSGGMGRGREFLGGLHAQWGAQQGASLHHPRDHENLSLNQELDT